MNDKIRRVEHKRRNIMEEKEHNGNGAKTNKKRVIFRARYGRLQMRAHMPAGAGWATPPCLMSL